MDNICPPKAEATGSNPVGCASFSAVSGPRKPLLTRRTSQEDARTDRERAYNPGTARSAPLGSIPRESWISLTDEVVYFIGAEGGPVKIGRSRSLARRIRELQVGHPGLIHVWALVPGGNLVEAVYHERFAKDRVVGEWFARTGEMQDFLDRQAEMRGDFGLPAPRQRDGLPQTVGGSNGCNDT